ncbi:MAG: tetratricopeptide repeat protein [Nitrospiraceae bacterium]|nr:tetratricopeptide repeat protein [Nitrospiraceae bacterium]
MGTGMKKTSGCLKNKAADYLKKAICGCLFIALFLLPLVSCSKKEEGPATSNKALSSFSAESEIFELEKKLKENPDDAEAWYHLADVYDRNGLYSKSVEAYRKTVSLKPDMGYAYLRMGTAYDRLHQPEQAVKAFEQAIKKMPDYAVAYNNLGVAYGKLGNSKKEIKNLEKAVKLRDRYATANFNLGMAYLRKGDRKSAMRQYKALMKIDEGMADDLLGKIKGQPQS